nr:hypothetical protein [Halapricum sp. CBA1109]
MTTSEAHSPTLTAAEATGTLALFIVLYVLLVAAALFVLRWLMQAELERMGVESTDRGSGRERLPWVSGDD